MLLVFPERAAFLIRGIVSRLDGARNFSIPIPLAVPNANSFPSPPSCTFLDIFRYSITATQDIAAERGRARAAKT